MTRFAPKTNEEKKLMAKSVVIFIESLCNKVDKSTIDNELKMKL